MEYNRKPASDKAGSISNPIQIKKNDSGTGQR